MGPGISRLERGGHPQAHVAPYEGGRARGGAAAAPTQLGDGAAPKHTWLTPRGVEPGVERKLPPPHISPRL